MRTFIITILALSISFFSQSQAVTSVTQFKDARPGAAYYEALTYLVDSMGCVSSDSGSLFRPDEPVTKAYWATLTSATFDRLNELIATNEYHIKDSAKRQDFGVFMLEAMPTNYCNIKDASITSVSQLKDIKENADYFIAAQGLIERYGLVWLATTTTFDPNTPISKPAFEKFFTEAFGAQFTQAGAGFLTRADLIIYTAAWTKNFIAKMERKIKADNEGE